MKEKYLLDDTPITYNAETNEIKYQHFEELIRTNKFYTDKRMRVFYERNIKQNFYKTVIKKQQKQILKKIKKILDKNKTSYRIIISPLYNQKKYSTSDIYILQNIFGKKFLFDFSGINEYTNSYKNYYENSHYRPTVAAKIMKEIYSK